MSWFVVPVFAAGFVIGYLLGRRDKSRFYDMTSKAGKQVKHD